MKKQTLRRKARLDHLIRIRVNPAQVKALSELAEQREVSASHLVREALRAYLAEGLTPDRRA